MASPETFDIPIGKVVGRKGDTGNGIKSIELLSTSGLSKTYRITMTDDTTFDFVVTDGNGITGASFDVETNELTITFDNETSFTTPSLKGNPGDDGYSPAVTIETITGGHRVTITDKTHPTGQSFDVLDGAPDAGSVSYDPSGTYQSGTVGAELQEQTRRLNDETTGLDTKAPVILDTASGAIATFTDGADSMPIKKLVAQIEPVQDLHGYDSPWPGGGGENLFRTTATGKTENGVTWTVNDDGSITAIGTSTGYTELVAGDAVVSGIDGYVTIRGFGIGTIGNIVWSGIGVYTSEGVAIGAVTGGSSQETFVVNLADYPNAGYIRCILKRNNNVATNATIKIQVSKGQTAPTTWTPYSNECPISGHTGASVQRTGVNVWDEQWEVGQIDPYTGEPTSANDRIRSKNFIRLEPSTTFYVVSDGMGSNDFRMCFYDKYKNFIAVGSWQYSSTFTTPDNAYYGKFVRVNTTTYNNNISINYPSTDTTYHPYTSNQISVTFPSEAGTVYGGTIVLNPDRTGTLVADKKIQECTGTSDEAWGVVSSGNTVRFVLTPADIKDISGTSLPSVKSNIAASRIGATPGTVMQYGRQIWYYPSDTTITTREQLKAFFSTTPAQFLYNLAEPQTFQLTAEQVSGILSTLYGQNNIWADTGDIQTCEYPADTKLYIDGKIAEALGG